MMSSALAGVYTYTIFCKGFLDRALNVEQIHTVGIYSIGFCYFFSVTGIALGI